MKEKKIDEKSRHSPFTNIRDGKVSAAIEAIGGFIARSNKVDAYLRSEQKQESARNRIVVDGWGRGNARPQNLMRRDI